MPPSSYEPFPIYSLDEGLRLDKAPWMIPSNAFTIAENVYFYQGRVYKRKGYEPFATGTPLWDIKFDGGQNEPAADDLIKSATETTGATIISVTVTSGSWAGNDAAGTLRVKKATQPAYADNEDLTNDTQGNTMAGGTGLGADGTAWQKGFNTLSAPPVMGIETF